jgi:hypothetical protein
LVGIPLSGVPSPVSAAPPATKKVKKLSVDALLATFAKMPGLYAKFREEKHMALLAAPLINEGTLHYQNGKLARHTTSPMRSSIVIDQDRIQFGDENGREQLELAGNPVVRLFVDSFVKILAGDKAALERIYDMKFEIVDASARRWKLVLRPKVDPMDKVIDRMELEGTDLVVSRMVVVEKGGDETVTTFTDVDVDRRYSKAEAARLFRVLGK